MAEQDPLPTFLIGVGEAGVEILEQVKETVPEEESAFFDYLAIDSNMEYLNSTTIEKSLYLQAPDTLVKQQMERFPYLNEDIQFGVKGAERQRPIGRFKLDNPNQPDFSAHFEDIEGHIRRFRQSHNADLTTQNKHLNIILVNSLSGGTGSGTYPLITAILHYLAESVRNRNQMFAYFAGFAIVSEFEYDGGVKDLPGNDGRYYANSYAALRDLQRLLNAGREETLRLPVYSQRITDDSDGQGTSQAIEEAMDENAFEFEMSPFNDYFLVGVDENRIQGERTFIGNERYDQVIDNQVAESIYTIAKHGQSLENVSGESDTDSRVGTVVETEVSVPHEKLVRYHEKKDEIEQLETLLFAGQELQDIIDASGLESEVEDPEDLNPITFLVRHPTVVFETMDQDRADSIKENIDDQIGATFGAGLNIANRTYNDLYDLLSRVEDTHDLRMLPYVLDEVEARVGEQKPAARENRAETVRDLWKYYGLSSHKKYGDVSSIEPRITNLEDYLREEIEETREELETAEESFWDGKPGIKGTRETLEERLSDREQSLERLQEVVDDYDGLHDLDDAITELRGDIEHRLKRKKKELDEARDSLQSLENELTDTEALSGLRMAEIPLSPEAFEEVTLTELNQELTDIKSYIDKGLVDEEDFRAIIARRFERCYNDEERLVLDVADDEEVDDELADEYFTLGGEETHTYIQYNEANEDVIGFDQVQIAVSDSAFNRYTDDRHDPYRVKFVTYVRTGPLEILRLYRTLQSFAEHGDLDDLVQARWGGDHRLAFAYPEWYGRDIQRRFNVDQRIELPYPPEPDLDDLRLDVEDEAELKHRLISDHGVVSYLYQGVRWEGHADGLVDFDGWGPALEDSGIGWQFLLELSPESEEQRQWLAGNVGWDELLEQYQEAFEEYEGIRIDFVEEQEAADD